MHSFCVMTRLRVFLICPLGAFVQLVYGRGLIKTLIGVSLSHPSLRRIPRISPLKVVRSLPYKLKLFGRYSILDGKGSVRRIALGQYPYGLFSLLYSRQGYKESIL